MKLIKLLTVSALASSMMSPAVMADTTFSPSQKTQIEKIIHDYLVNSPEVLMEASQALQVKQQLVQQKEAKSAILQNSEQLLTEKIAFAGNPKGNVTIVEFFDNQCGHCKTMKPILAALIEKDNNVRVIYKEFPIFGKSSELAARAALAAGMQGKYVPMHDVLLQADKRLDKAMIMEAAKTAGLDMPKFTVDMDSKTVTDALEENRKLAEKLHLMGTPAFIVLSTPNGKLKAGAEASFVPGGIGAEALQALVDKSAAAGK